LIFGRYTQLLVRVPGTLISQNFLFFFQTGKWFGKEFGISSRGAEGGILFSSTIQYSTVQYSTVELRRIQGEELSVSTLTHLSSVPVTGEPASY
jgi:hypothetical protein